MALGITAGAAFAAEQTHDVTVMLEGNDGKLTATAVAFGNNPINPIQPSSNADIRVHSNASDGWQNCDVDLFDANDVGYSGQGTTGFDWNTKVQRTRGVYLVLHSCITTR